MFETPDTSFRGTETDNGKNTKGKDKNSFLENRLKDLLLGDYLTWRVAASDLPGDEKHSRWPVNFASKGLISSWLVGTGRIAKVLEKGVWRYVIIGGIELHGAEGKLLK